MNRKDQLLFIRFLPPQSEDKTQQVRYRGTISVNDDSSTKLRRLGYMRDYEDQGPFEILEAVSSENFRTINPRTSIKKLGLRTGSILLLRPTSSGPRLPLNEGLLKDIGLKPYGRYKRTELEKHPVLKGLWRQALDAQGMDVVFTSPPASPQKFQITAHQSVLRLLLYFRSVFASGMSESKTSVESGIVKLEIPLQTSEHIFREFLMFVYFRDQTRLEKLAPGVLLRLLLLADFYGFDDLLESIAWAFEEGYSSLSEEIALQALTTIHPLEFNRKHILEEVTLHYILSNFEEVAKLRAFRELEDEIHDQVIEEVAGVLSKGES
jgi:hypothetical protein